MPEITRRTTTGSLEHLADRLELALDQGPEQLGAVAFQVVVALRVLAGDLPEAGPAEADAARIDCACGAPPALAVGYRGEPEPDYQCIRCATADPRSPIFHRDLSPHGWWWDAGRPVRRHDMTGVWQYRYQVSTMREQDHGWTSETFAALTWTPWFDLVEFTFLTMHVHKVEFRICTEPAR